MKGTPHIKRLAIRLFIGLLTFLIGVATSSVWSLVHYQRVESSRFLSGQPCRDGVVSVESRSDVPLRITISDTACDNPQSANVHFVVENVSTKPITRYEIRSLRAYDELTDEGSGVSTETIEPLQPRQTQIGFLGGGVVRGSCGKPVSELKSFQLVVWSIDFADGTTWTRRSRSRNDGSPQLNKPATQQALAADSL